MVYSFETDLAKKYGIDHAIVIEQFCLLIKEKKAVWLNVYCKDYIKIFPFWSMSKTHKLITELSNLNVIEINKVNEKVYRGHPAYNMYRIIDEEVLEIYGI